MSIIRRASSRVLELLERGADPGVVAGVSQVYGKDDAGTSQLFEQDGGGTVRQITPTPSKDYIFAFSEVSQAWNVVNQAAMFATAPASSGITFSAGTNFNNLQSGVTYLLFFQSQRNAGGTGGVQAFQWFDITGAALIPMAGFSTPVSSSSPGSNTMQSIAIFTPGALSSVQVRLTSTQGGLSPRRFAWIEELP